MLKVYMFGGFSLTASAKLAHGEFGAGGRRLSAYLFTFPNATHRRAKLVDLFWPEQDPDQARAALSTALWRLRRLLATAKSEGDPKIVATSHDLMLTAMLLGKSIGREVYRVDLSTVVSKYIGETEKNLAVLFDRAGNRDWILFFDEADALFGKRTGVKDAHDRYANQEVSYLLQRVEDFDGLVILASNFRANMDEAFLRRFNAIIRFPMPTEAEREAIWTRILPDRAGRDRLAGLLCRFELSGGNIANVVQFAAIEAIAAGRDAVSLADAVKGVEREMEKEGKVFRNLLEAEQIADLVS